MILTRDWLEGEDVDRLGRRYDRNFVAPVGEDQKDVDVMASGHMVFIFGFEGELLVMVEDRSEKQNRGLFEHAEMFFHETDDLALRVEELLGTRMCTDFRKYPDHDGERTVFDTRTMERVGEES